MAFNVPDEIKSKSSLISIAGVAIKNVRTFKYLGHLITNTDEDPSSYLTFRISSAFQKWNELKFVLTDKRINMSSRIKILEACVRSRLLYSAQSLELTSSELNKLETIWHGFLRKMVANGFKRKNVPVEYLKARKDAKKSNRVASGPGKPGKVLEFDRSWKSPGKTPLFSNWSWKSWNFFPNSAIICYHVFIIKELLIYLTVIVDDLGRFDNMTISYRKFVEHCVDKNLLC